MIKEKTAIGILKEQIYELMEQLADEDLYRLREVLSTWISEYRTESRNGVYGELYENESSQFSKDAKEKYPWLKYIEKLKDSPNKDIFLEEMTKIREETNKIEWD